MGKSVMIMGALLALTRAAAAAPAEAGSAAPPACVHDQSGLTLPSGFCATVFADGIGHARHLTVGRNGVVYVNTWSGRYYASDPRLPPGGFLVALQDTAGTGVANVVKRFGDTVQSGGHGGTGIALFDGYLYAESNDRIERYALPADAIVSSGAPQTVVSGLPLTGDHPMRPFVIDADGALYIDVASATNSCQARNRTLRSPGLRPCRELRTRGGIWRYDARRTGQVFSAAARYATGIRNAEGLAVGAGGHGLFSTQHGRDQLHADWPDLYRPEQEATLPAEELLRIVRGGDYGWPECYYDPVQAKLVLAPEYGGDGGRTVGVCAHKRGPVAAFPAHWAPNDLLLYSGDGFPAHYRHGAFIAFHGSWDRAPYAQAGYNVVFQPLTGDKAAGPCEIFADGFAGATRSPKAAEHRPSGLALGPDGALYVADDVRGRIYRIVYVGAADGAATSGAGHITPCSPADASAGPLADANAKLPAGLNPDAGAKPGAKTGRESGGVPEGATPAMVALGERIYHGEVGGAGCTGCHGNDAGGSPLGPDLRAHRWLWSDGSFAGIERTITQGVPDPREYGGPMPPLGGADLSEEQVAAVAAYIWSLSHGPQGAR